MEREALKLALEALKEIARHATTPYEDAWCGELADETLTAINALAQPAQEPVAWMYPDALCDRACLYVCTKAFTQFPECATAPPQPAQKPKSFTYNEVADAMNSLRKGNSVQKAYAEEMGKLKLYAAPQQRPWVGLTAQEAAECWTTSATQTWKNFEAKLKDKNNG